MFAITYLFLIFISAAILTRAQTTLSLNVNHTETIQYREKKLFKIESCQDLEIQLSVQGAIQVESGPYLQGSMTLFQTVFNVKITNGQQTGVVFHPFANTNFYSEHVCSFYVSITGSSLDLTDSDSPQPSSTFWLYATPKYANQIQTIPQQISDPNTLYTHQTPERSNLIFVLQESYQITSFPLNLHVTNEIDQSNSNTMSLPKLTIINDNIREFTSQYNQANSQSSTTTTQEQKNCFLNKNFVKTLTKQRAGEVSFQLERLDNWSKTTFQVTQSNYARFQKIGTSQANNFVGFNLNLGKCQRRAILANNNGGDFSLDIISAQHTKIKVYFNPSSEVINSGNCWGIPSQASLLTMNYQSNILINTVLVSLNDNDIIVIESIADNIQLSIELKPKVIGSLDPSVTPLSFNLIQNEVIMTNSGDTLKKIYLFFSNDQSAALQNCITGESESGLLYFTETQISQKIKLSDILSSNPQNSKTIYVSARAYDSFNRVILYQPVIIRGDTSSSASWFSWLIIIWVLIGIVILKLGVKGIQVLVKKHRSKMLFNIVDVSQMQQHVVFLDQSFKKDIQIISTNC